MHVLSVQLTVKPGQRKEFLAEMGRHIAWTIDNEEGCLQFDLSQSKEDDHTFHLYEVYRDDQALEVHMSSMSLKQFRDTTESMIEKRQVLSALRHSTNVV